MTPALAFEIRKAYDRRGWAAELMGELQLPPTAFDVQVGLADDPETAAAKIRSALGVRTELQSQWRIDNEVFREWRAPPAQ